MNIYLFGEAGAGKDTVAYYLAKHQGYEAFALGDGPKFEYAKFFGRRPTKADRAKVIDIAESYKRIYGADVWCKQTYPLIETWSELNAHPPILISDGRFLAEYDFFVTQRGYVPVYLHADYEVRMKRLVERDGVDQREVLKGKEDEVVRMAHMTEYFLVNNESGFDSLEYQLDTLLEALTDARA